MGEMRTASRVILGEHWQAAPPAELGVMRHSGGVGHTVAPAGAVHDSASARVTAALNATPRYLPPADTTPRPPAPFIGVASGETAPPPIDMAARIAGTKGGR
jgi:hypothetical protein